MKIFKKLTLVFVFIVIQALYVPLWAVDVHSIQGKYGFNFQGAVHYYQSVIETTKGFSKGSKCAYHIGTLWHIPGIDTVLSRIV